MWTLHVTFANGGCMRSAPQTVHPNLSIFSLNFPSSTTQPFHFITELTPKHTPTFPFFLIELSFILPSSTFSFPSSNWTFLQVHPPPPVPHWTFLQAHPTFPSFQLNIPSSMSLDSYSLLKVRPQTVTVLCKGKNISKMLAADWNNHEQVHQGTITFIGRNFQCLLLSVDTLLWGTDTFACKSNWAVQGKTTEGVLCKLWSDPLTN